MNLHETLLFIGRRRWALTFLLLVAGVFAAPFLYWNSILMRVVLQAARGEPVLLWLNAVNALGGLLLIPLACFGAGGCLSSLRRMLRGTDGFLPREVFLDMGRHAKSSLLTGLVLGLSLGFLRVGLVNLHLLQLAGGLRAIASAFLVVQLIAAIWWVFSSRKHNLFILLIFALDALILLLPSLRSGPLASLSDTLAFVSRLYADSGTLLRDLLAASGVWPILLCALLGSACCVMAAYACACYKFHGRGLLFAAAVLLQIFPMLASTSSLEQLLRNLELPVKGALLVLAWALAYLLTALLLLRRFAKLLPGLQKNRDTYPGARLFFYYALPRAPLQTLALIALATLGCWADALAPFWYMRRLGAFSLTGFVWEHLSGPGELALYGMVFLAILGLFSLIALRIALRGPRSPRPSAD